MYRDIDRLSEESFDLAIVGGGILGAFLAHESSRRGMKTALIERRDFASGTTSASGKVLHGGLRYLQHLELGLAAESHREQCRIAALAPRLVRAVPFVVPARSGRTGEAAMLRGAAWGWGVVRRLLPGSDGLPPPRYLDERALGRTLGDATAEGFSGALRFHDWQIRSPERLTVALVCDARDHGAAVANYVEAVGFETSGGRVEGVSALDRRSGRRFRVRARTVANAAGPWGIDLAESVDGSLSDVDLARGAHVVVDLPEPPASVALPARGQAAGSALGTERRVFVMPWEGKTLVGATYSPHRGEVGRVRPEPGEVAAFLDEIGRAWPRLGLRDAEPLFAYAGLYPIFGGGEGDDATFEASLRPRVVDHRAHGGPSGLISAVSVKLTGAWKLAEDVLSLAEEKFGRDAVTPSRPSSRSLSRAGPTPLASGDDPGTRRSDLAEATRLERAVDVAVREEMAVTVPDFLFRRTSIGHHGRPDRDRLDFIARQMGRRLAWDESDVDEQIGRALDAYRAVTDIGPDVANGGR